MSQVFATIESLLKELQTIAALMPRPGCEWESRPEFLAPPLPEDFEAARIAIGELLPEELAAFLELSGGIVAMGVHNGYHVCGATMIAQMLTRHDGWPPCEIAEAGQWERVVPVALDGGGNTFVLSPESGRVWRWDHETRATLQVARSFTEFLGRVLADWEAYVGDRPSWKFLV